MICRHLSQSTPIQIVCVYKGFRFGRLCNVVFAICFVVQSRPYYHIYLLLLPFHLRIHLRSISKHIRAILFPVYCSGFTLFYLYCYTRSRCIIRQSASLSLVYASIFCISLSIFLLFSVVQYEITSSRPSLHLFPPHIVSWPLCESQQQGRHLRAGSICPAPPCFFEKGKRVEQETQEEERGKKAKNDTEIQVCHMNGIGLHCRHIQTHGAVFLMRQMGQLQGRQLGRAGQTFSPELEGKVNHLYACQCI